MIGKGLTMKGFLVGSYSQHAPAFTAEVGGWLAAGTMSYDETVVDGIERNVEAFLGLLRGENTGKMLVRVADAPS
jgi:NADPH-dependent curcumin reductase CurA